MPTTNPENVAHNEQLGTLASILAEGYLRLVQIRRGGRRETGQFGDDSALVAPLERLDFYETRSDELGPG